MQLLGHANDEEDSGKDGGDGGQYTVFSQYDMSHNHTEMEKEGLRETEVEMEVDGNEQQGSGNDSGQA